MRFFILLWNSVQPFLICSLLVFRSLAIYVVLVMIRLLMRVAWSENFQHLVQNLKFMVISV